MKKYVFFLVLLSCSALLSDSLRLSNRKPKYGDLKLSLEETILISESEGNDSYMFQSIRDIALDSRDHLYLIDSKRVMKYDKDGNFLFQIGRYGQGPGEYGLPCGLFIDPADNLYINDQGIKLMMFDAEGNFNESIQLRYAIGLDTPNFIVDKDGCIIALTRDVSEIKINKILIRADKTAARVRKISEFNESDLKVSAKGSGGVIGGIKHVYSPVFCFCLVGVDRICYGNNMEYQLTISRLDGTIRKIFDKKVKSIPITAEEKSKLGKSKNIVFPSFRPFFNKVLSDERGRIYVVRAKSILDTKKEVDVDIYDHNGYLLYEVKIPHSPSIIRNGNIIVVDQDDQGHIVIKKMTIKNYASVRHR